MVKTFHIKRFFGISHAPNPRRSSGRPRRSHSFRFTGFNSKYFFVEPVNAIQNISYAQSALKFPLILHLICPDFFAQNLSDIRQSPFSVDRADPVQ